jgi:hypothetical protein
MSVGLALAGYALVLFVYWLQPDPGYARGLRNARFLLLGGFLMIAGGVINVVRLSWLLWKRRR